jgi:hypothetical protein
MSGLAARAARWAGRKAIGAVTDSAKSRARRAKCKAEPHGPGKLCNRSLRTGRLADGMTCGRELCQLWYMAKDERETARYLGMSVDELAERVAAARAA